MAPMVPITRPFADDDGRARFEEGFGHSSRTSDGFVAAFVILDP
jgi:hypothetical protein